MSNKFDSERGTLSPPPLNIFFKYLLVNLILQIEVLCPYKLHNGRYAVCKDTVPGQSLHPADRGNV